MSQTTINRRKVRGLTRTGRQVSEDPDLDNLLSNLSPEEMEELEQDMAKVPDLDPKDGVLLAQGGEVPATQQQQPATNNVQEDTRLGPRGDSSDPKGWRSQREQSLEGEPKRETRKQEYLRKMGLSQEGDDHKRGRGAPQRQASVEQDYRLEERNNTEERAGLSNRYRKWGSRDGDIREETKDKDRCEDSLKLKDNRESTGNKTRDMISKLQKEKKDDGGGREKDRKEDCRRRDDSKTKDIISKLREKSEKDAGKEKDRKDDVRSSRGLVSKMVEKQSKAHEGQGQDSTLEERKAKVEEKKDVDMKDKPDGKLERQRSEKGDDDDVQVKDDKEGKRKANEEEVKHNDHVKDNATNGGEKSAEQNNLKEDSKANVTNDEGSTPNKESKHVGNCVTGKNGKTKTKEEEEEDEDSSMFDELMEQVRSNDPSLYELNVNNSEVIRVKTLIQFAEALHGNAHVKTFALANCRADDHVAYAIAGTLRNNKTVTSVNLDSNHLTPKGILSLIQALQHNATLTELRFHNQRHICGGKTEMEMTKILKDNTTLLKLGYHFELAGPRMTMTNILSRNMDRQRQRRLQEQKQAQANGDKKGTLDVPKSGGGSLRGSPRASPRPSPMASPMPSPKLLKRVSGGLGAPPPPPPPPGGGPPPPPPPPGCGPPPPPPPMDNKGPVSSKSSRDQLLSAIRGSDNKHKLKKVPVPKWLQ